MAKIKVPDVKKESILNLFAEDSARVKALAIIELKEAIFRVCALISVSLAFIESIVALLA